MKTNQSPFDRPTQSTQPGEMMPTQLIELYHPAWLKNGDSPAEIILSTAILPTFSRLFTTKSNICERKHQEIAE
jgi:hypothetical protein